MNIPMENKKIMIGRNLKSAFSGLRFPFYDENSVFSNVLLNLDLEWCVQKMTIGKMVTSIE